MRCWDLGCLLSVFEKQSSLHRKALPGSGVIYDAPDAYLGAHVGKPGSEMHAKHSWAKSKSTDIRVLLSPRRNRKSLRQVVVTGGKLEPGAPPVIENAN